MLRLHTEEKHLGIKHDCNICDYHTTSKQCLRMHTAAKHLGTGHGCYICGYQAYTTYMLKRHIMSHGGEKANKCNQCDSSFIRKYGLLRHMKKHKEEKKKYGPAFELHRYSSKLIEGESIGKFQCNLCVKISNSRSDSFKHVESVHYPGSFQYECAKCGDKFGTKNKLVRHRWRVHSSKKHNREKPKKPSNNKKLQTIVKLGLHLAMEKNSVPQRKECSASNDDSDDVEVIWSDYCE